MPSVNDFLIDFSKEEQGGGNNIKVPDAKHRVKVLNAKPTVSAQKGTEGLEVVFAFLDGKLRKKKITDTLWATPKAYSRFRLLLEACDVTVPGKIKLSSIAAKIKGKELYIETETEEREGYSARSRVAFQGFINAEDYDPDVEDDEDDEELEDEDEELEDEDDEEEDEDDEEEEEEEPAPKRRAKKAAPAKKRRKPEPEEDEDDEDEEDEDEEEEPAPRKRKAATKKAPAKKSRSKRKAADDDEDDDDLSDLDLDDL